MFLLFFLKDVFFLRSNYKIKSFSYPQSLLDPIGLPSTIAAADQKYGSCCNRIRTAAAGPTIIGSHHSYIIVIHIIQQQYPIDDKARARIHTHTSIVYI